MQDVNHLRGASGRFPLPVVHVMLSDADKNELLAQKINGRIKELDLSKQQFASMMQVQPSSVTKWLSGRHNFTLQTIYQIERILGLPLMNLSCGQQRISTTYNFHISARDHISTAAKLLNHLKLTDASQVSIVLHNEHPSPSPFKALLLYDVNAEENIPVYEYKEFVKSKKR